MAARVLVVGKLSVRGGSVEFVPVPDLDLEARRGEPVELAVEYAWEEGDVRRETCELAFRAARGTVVLGTDAAVLDDRPGVKDRAHGRLRILAPLEAGDDVVHYAVEAVLAARPWRGGRPEARDFRREGRIRVRVT